MDRNKSKGHHQDSKHKAKTKSETPPQPVLDGSAASQGAGQGVEKGTKAVNSKPAKH